MSATFTYQTDLFTLNPSSATISPPFSTIVTLILSSITLLLFVLLLSVSLYRLSSTISLYRRYKSHHQHDNSIHYGILLSVFPFRYTSLIVLSTIFGILFNALRISDIVNTINNDNNSSTHYLGSSLSSSPSTLFFYFFIILWILGLTESIQNITKATAVTAIAQRTRIGEMVKRREEILKEKKKEREMEKEKEKKDKMGKSKEKESHPPRLSVNPSVTIPFNTPSADTAETIFSIQTENDTNQTNPPVSILINTVDSVPNANDSLPISSPTPTSIGHLSLANANAAEADNNDHLNLDMDSSLISPIVISTDNNDPNSDPNNHDMTILSPSTTTTDALDDDSSNVFVKVSIQCKVTLGILSRMDLYLRIANILNGIIFLFPFFYPLFITNDHTSDTTTSSSLLLLCFLMAFGPIPYYMLAVAGVLAMRRISREVAVFHNPNENQNHNGRNSVNGNSQTGQGSVKKNNNNKVLPLPLSLPDSSTDNNNTVPPPSPRPHNSTNGHSTSKSPSDSTSTSFSSIGLNAEQISLREKFSRLYNSFGRLILIMMSSLFVVTMVMMVVSIVEEHRVGVYWIYGLQSFYAVVSILRMTKLKLTAKFDK